MRLRSRREGPSKPSPGRATSRRSPHPAAACARASSKERAKLSVRLDGHNLPWKRPNLSAPGTTYNLNSPGAFGRFTGTVGDFSNFGTAQANVQANIRVEF